MKDKGKTEVLPEQLQEECIKLLNGHKSVMEKGKHSEMVNGDADINLKNGENGIINGKNKGSTSDLSCNETSTDKIEVRESETSVRENDRKHGASKAHHKEPLTIYYEYQKAGSINELHTAVDTFNVDIPIDDSPVDNIQDSDNETERPLLQKGLKYKQNLANLKDDFPIKLDLSTKTDKWTFDIDSSTYTETTVSRTQSCLDDPPDGGWGWVVTFSAFMVGLILDGISFSFGVFFKELYVYFNESKSLTSWIISVMNGTYLAIGKCRFL